MSAGFAKISRSAVRTRPHDKQAFKEEMEWQDARWRFRTELIGKHLSKDLSVSCSNASSAILAVPYHTCTVF
jgi:hypothetical protein